jgi:hypothetical protein
VTVVTRQGAALPPRAAARGGGGLLVDAIVFVLAVAARLGVIYGRGSSLFDGASYDPSVYYAAADSFIHGRLPYRDFTLMHPPGVMLALSPIAFIGRLTSDRTGFEIATVVALVVGAASAVLVWRIARATGVRRSIAVTAGLLYAVTPLSVGSESSARLEVFGNFLTLLGIWCYVTSARRQSRLMLVSTGAALAAAASVKIWYAVPLVLVLLWHTVDRRSRRSLWWAVGGAAVAAGCIDGPFLILSGRSMVRMVVLDQFGRTGGVSVLSRASDLDLLTRLRPHSSANLQLGCAVVAGVIVVLALLLAWRTPGGRLPATLLAADLAVLFAAPVYLLSYADFAMPAACLCAAAAMQALAQTRSPVLSGSVRGLAATLVAGSALAAVLATSVNVRRPSEPSPDRYLQTAAAAYRCVQSDSPEPLIALNVLSSDLQHGCPQWVDVSGRTYGVDRSPTNQSRRKNRRWQRDLVHYLRAGQAYVLVDVKREGLSRRTLALLRRGPLIARGDRLALRIPQRRSGPLPSL